jgi:2-oxoglutarate ferredoxin oxidoreductase subunit beta
MTELETEGVLKKEDAVAVAGIGCHAKILDYLDMNTLNALHGRALPAATGVKVANAKLTVSVFSGDGDSYAEGLSHLLHAAQRNSHLSVFIHDNQVFALTTGQATPVSPRGYKGSSRPQGTIDDPLNPLLLLLASGATFVARTYAGDIEKTKTIMKAAMTHKGFAFVDIIQPCITFFDTRDLYKDHLAWLPEDHPVTDLGAAMAATRRDDGMVPAGIFYRTQKPTFEEQL